MNTNLSTRKKGGEEKVELIERRPGSYLVEGVHSGKRRRLLRKLALTKSTIDSLPLQAEGQRLHTDRDLGGFALLIGQTAKSYIIQADLHGKPKRITIGKHGLYTPDEARRKAYKLLQLIREGVDPTAKKREAKRETPPPTMTLKQTFEKYLQVRPLKPATRKDYSQVFRRSFDDWLDLSITKISKSMILEKHERNKKRFGAPYADYGMRIVSALMNFAAALDEKLSEADNPVRVLSLTRAWTNLKPRTNYITEEQLPKWFKAIEELREEGSESSITTGLDYLTFVLFTGLRRNEAATLRWENINFNERTVTIEETKNGETHVLPLTDYLLQLLQRRKEEAYIFDSPWVFPSVRYKGKHLTEPRYVADLVTEKCGVKFTIHDLRRTFCTVAEGLDLSYYAIKKLMNHKLSGDVTWGYQRSTVKRLREPMEKITNYFLAKRTRGIRVRLAS